LSILALPLETDLVEAEYSLPGKCASLLATPLHRYPRAKLHALQPMRGDIAVPDALLELDKLREHLLPHGCVRFPREADLVEAAYAFAGESGSPLELPLISYPRGELRILRPPPWHVAVPKAALE
jgi:hypothetical protein